MNINSSQKILEHMKGFVNTKLIMFKWKIYENECINLNKEIIFHVNIYIIINVHFHIKLLHAFSE